jgi:hypothetical protein
MLPVDGAEPSDVEAEGIITYDWEGNFVDNAGETLNGFFAKTSNTEELTEITVLGEATWEGVAAETFAEGGITLVVEDKATLNFTALTIPKDATLVVEDGGKLNGTTGTKLTVVGMLQIKGDDAIESAAHAIEQGGKVELIGETATIPPAKEAGEDGDEEASNQNVWCIAPTIT